MIFLGNKTRHTVFWLGLAGCVVLLPLNIMASIRLSLDSIFSGLLALTGFVFTARTFITFKLQEVVYGNPGYQRYVEKLRQDGAYDRELYAPLKELDANLGNTTGMCLAALALFAMVSIIPECKPIVLDANTTVYKCLDFFNKNNIGLLAQNLKTLRFLPAVVVTDAAVLYFFFVLWQVFRTTLSLNKNIHSIIEHWEEDYRVSQRDKPSVSGSPRR